MIVENIRLSESAKRQLISLKRHTGIENWNTLCRWGFCLSVRDLKPITYESGTTQSNIEMTWRTFAGAHHAAYEAVVRLLIAKQLEQGQPIEALDLLRGHIDRGLSKMRSIVAEGGIKGLLRTVA